MNKSGTIYKIVDGIIVIICLPFYATVFPFFYIGCIRKSKLIQKLNCPHCKSILQDIVAKDIACCSIKLRLTKNSVVDWDHMPQNSVTCKSCDSSICFDKKTRITSCNHTDFISSKSNT